MLSLLCLNANDYGVLFQDQFNTSVQAGTFFCPNNFTCNFNYTIPPGSGFAQVVFNAPNINRGYFVPPLNGYYYLVMMADPGGSFTEQNEQNNLFYTTGQLPKYFTGGYSNRSIETADTFKFKNPDSPILARLLQPAYNTTVNEKNRNAYTPEEIIYFIKQKVRNGELRKKIALNSVNLEKDSTAPYKH